MIEVSDLAKTFISFTLYDLPWISSSLKILVFDCPIGVLGWRWLSKRGSTWSLESSLSYETLTSARVPFVVYLLSLGEASSGSSFSCVSFSMGVASSGSSSYLTSFSFSGVSTIASTSNGITSFFLSESITLSSFSLTSC